jgi:DNA-directed RNA polymerase specialized sigma24 family protein
MEGVPLVEIAAALGLMPATVRRRKADAIVRLRNMS